MSSSDTGKSVDLTSASWAPGEYDRYMSAQGVDRGDRTNRGKIHAREFGAWHVRSMIGKYNQKVIADTHGWCSCSTPRNPAVLLPVTSNEVMGIVDQDVNRPSPNARYRPNQRASLGNEADQDCQAA